MRKIKSLPAILTLVLASFTAFGQISNTATSITLQHNPSGVQQAICPWNQSIPSGPYTIEVQYISEDYSNYGNWVTVQAQGTVTNNISTTGQILINLSSGTLPTDAVDGWSLVFTQGHVTITGGGLTSAWQQAWDFDQFNCYPLPLFLTGFYVDKTYSSSNYFKINWQTMQERNTSHFIVQRSGDGRHFTDVLMEPAAGESDSTINYTGYINGTGYNWFRLKAIDADGSYQYSNIKWWEVVRTGASNFCSFTYMEGPDKICGSSAIFKLHNVPAGTVNWSLSAYGNISTSHAGLVATVNRAGVGNATLTATPSAGCAKSKSLLLGSPYIGGTYFSNNQEYPLAIWSGDPWEYNNVCNLQTVNTNMQVLGASSVNWSKVSSSPSSISFSQSGNNISFYFYNVDQNAVFRIQASNGCGSASYDFGFKSISCSGGGGGGCYAYQVSPNPARGSLNIVSPQIVPPCYQATAQSQQFTNLSISEIRIYDQQGFLQVKKKFANAKSAQVGLANLKSGIYIVEITGGQYTERQQIIVQD